MANTNSALDTILHALSGVTGRREGVLLAEQALPCFGKISFSRYSDSVSSAEPLPTNQVNVHTPGCSSGAFVPPFFYSIIKKVLIGGYLRGWVSKGFVDWFFTRIPALKVA